MTALNLVIQAAKAPGPYKGDICFHSIDQLRFQNLSKSQHRNYQFCAPLTKVMMSQVEKTCIFGRKWIQTDGKNLPS